MKRELSSLPLAAKEAAESEPLLARGSVAAPETAVGEFMFMPGGVHTIYCRQGSKDVAATVQVDRSAAAAMQQQLECVKARSAHRPFCDFDHDDKQASFWPEAFAWREQPAAGIYVSGEWSKAGHEAIAGKTYRAFSPVFHVDDVKARPARVICHEGAGLNFGGLVNNPAFKKICPIWAKHAGPAGAAVSNHNSNDTMTDQEKAALEARIQQTENELAELQAKDQSNAEVAEAILARNQELTLMQAQLAAKVAEDRAATLEKEVLANRALKAQEAVSAAVKRGAIPARDTALQAAWVKKCTEDPDGNIPLLEKIPGSPALAAGRSGGGGISLMPSGGRQVMSNLIVSRTSNEDVLRGMSSIAARQSNRDLPYSERPAVARELAAIYAKEILPRLREGDDIPLTAANSLGTLASTLVATRTLELLTQTFPLLQSIMTDFSDQIVSYGDTLKSRYVGIPTVQTYNTTTGWPTNSDVTTTDVSITYDQYKGVPVIFQGHEVAGTVRRLFDEIAPAQAYALGKDIVDYVYALITAAFTNTTTAAGLGTFGRSTIIDLGGILDDAANPDMGRTLLLNRPYYSALSKDSTIIQLAAFQKADVITKGMEASTLQDVEGFRVIKAVNLPATAIGGQTLKGFGFTKSALALATRLSADYVNAIPGAGNGNLTVVTTPGGFSANLVQFVSHTASYAAQRLEIIYGASRGQVAAGALLTDV